MSSTGRPIWRVANTGGADQLYRFTNLADHTAWRVVVCRDDGTDIAVPGHVSYARGWFEQSLTPGRYSLRWETTLEMLRPRAGAPARPAPQSMPFRVPLADGSALDLGVRQP